MFIGIFSKNFTRMTSGDFLNGRVLLHCKVSDKSEVETDEQLNNLQHIFHA